LTPQPTEGRTMNHLKAVLRPIYRRSVWHPLNTLKIPPRYRDLYTKFLPSMYAMFAVLGGVSYLFRVNALDKVISPEYGAIWALFLVFASVASFVGIAFYNRLLTLELFGLSGLIALIIFLLGCMTFLTFQDKEVSRAYLVVALALFLWLPNWRIKDIVNELRPAARSAEGAGR
jgi:hypothetical protein